MQDRTGSDNRKVTELHSAARAVGEANLRLLRAIVACDRPEVWEDEDVRSFAEWLSGQLGVSHWIARRRINAAHTLPHLPRLTCELENGTLSLEKIVELCRWATAETEKKLIPWARRVCLSAIRQRADYETQRALDEVTQDHRQRSLSFWWTDEGRFLQITGALPADQGAVVASALDRLAERIPDIVEDEGDVVASEFTLDARRADALYALASAAIANDQDADRATVVVHADLHALDREGSCRLQGGGIVHSETALRMSCDARLQFTVHGTEGQVVGVGRVTRTPPPWMQRLLRHRDGGCTFPNCESKWFLHAHHIHHWAHGGPTDLDNLTLTCTFHHKLVHEYGWDVALTPDGSARWFRPDGREHLPTSLLERSPPDPQTLALV